VLCYQEVIVRYIVMAFEKFYFQRITFLVSKLDLNFILLRLIMKYNIFSAFKYFFCIIDSLIISVLFGKREILFRHGYS
jgi:hypothetical protein